MREAKGVLSFVSFLAFILINISNVAQADVFASFRNNLCLANQGGEVTLQACSAQNHNVSMRYIPNENVFYGPLMLAGQCLDIAGGRVVFSRCNGSKSQVWKLSGNGQLSNEQGNCVNGHLGVGGCPHGSAFYNLTYKIISVTYTTKKIPPKGTFLAINGNDIINKATREIVAGGAGNIVAGGAGNIVAGGAGNIVAGGAGNIVVSTNPNISNIVAAGAGN